jgi:2-oxo-4-hydroxy-4-carboxy-5-ureidoimidazoline decarboxylase
MDSPVLLEEINRIDRDEFVARLGGVYEDSPWVAAAVAEGRPFATADTLIAAMRAVVDKVTPEQQLRLILAHPDLAGRLAMAGELSDSSRQEQSGVGLDRLSPPEFAEFQDLNARYRAKHGFPFIICVRRTDKAGILAAFHRRLPADTTEEIQTALMEIHHIARLRVQDLMGR